MFKNNISKEFCQQMTKRCDKKSEQSEASEGKNEEKAYFGILRLFRANKLSKKRKIPFTFWQNLAEPRTSLLGLKSRLPSPPPLKMRIPHAPAPPNLQVKMISPL